MATNHSGFPAPTIPYSLSDDEDDDQPHNRHHPPPSTFANKVLPPTPSPLTSASGRLSKDLPQIPAESSRSNTHPPVDGGIDVQRWISDSDSQVHEMDMYHGHSDDEEAGLTSTDRRKARLPKRGIGIRIGAGDESEEALMGGDNIDAEEDDILTPEEKKEADGLVVRNLAINLILIGLWYVSPSRGYLGAVKGCFLGIYSRS